MPVYEVYMQVAQGELALLYLIKSFEARMFYNDLTMLN
jgi:hypothetical protein